ncbi:hypothetical protein NP568_24005, partial [Vibrio parahaemolyticus]|nr:hypothetical protein [Vibrio parahaemolyticus]
LVQEQVFAILTIDNLTCDSSFSKFNIFYLFFSKEDVILELCIHSLKREAIFFESTANLDGNSLVNFLAMVVGSGMLGGLGGVVGWGG